LDALIELERARLAAIPQEWEDVVAGRVSVDDAEQRIRARGGADERELARARELFAPLSADFEAGLVERLIPTAPVPISSERRVIPAMGTPHHSVLGRVPRPHPPPPSRYVAGHRHEENRHRYVP